MRADFAFVEVGDEFLLRPLTSPARKWLVENVRPDTPYIGTAALVPAGAIGVMLAAICEAGFIVVRPPQR